MNDILLTLKPWYPSISAFLFFTVVRYIYKNFFIRLLRRLNNKVSFGYGEYFLNAFETPINIALFIIAFYAAINLSPLASVHDFSFTDRILRTIIVTNFFWGLYNLIDTTHGVFFDLLERFGIQTDEAIANILATVFRIIIIMLGFVTVAREWNYDISAFIASLSIGSLAVAFAAKDALANVFGSMIILLDKPFKIGDWIKANGIEGIVESVSFRSTCIRTFPQELVYIPNSLLSNTPITNYTLRERRRIDFTLGLTYGTTAAQIEEFIFKLKNYLEDLTLIDENDVRVHFVTYNSSSLDIRVVCYAKTGKHLEYLNIMQEINLHILELLEEVGVSCAFPSTSLYFETPLQENVTEQPAKAQSEADKPKDNSTSANC